MKQHNKMTVNIMKRVSLVGLLLLHGRLERLMVLVIPATKNSKPFTATTSNASLLFII
jgi:hypothetical protein